MTVKVFMITGASAGIGIETARALHATGAKIYLPVRSKAKAGPVVEDILKTSPSKTPIELITMDLSSLDSVRAAVKEFLSKEKQLNVLVNNAGIMACPEGKTVDGFETHIGTNHFGHFLLFHLLRPTLLASSTSEFQSRVVSVSSAGHRMRPIHFDNLNWETGYTKFGAYGQSKTANIYLANSIEKHYGSKGLHAVSVHPGVIIDTELPRHMDEADFALLGGLDSLTKIAKSMPQGAATTVWAAISKHFESKGGVYCADVGESGPIPKDVPEGPGGPAYAPHVSRLREIVSHPGRALGSRWKTMWLTFYSQAYDDDAAERLWGLSYEAVGLKDED